MKPNKKVLFATIILAYAILIGIAVLSYTVGSHQKRTYAQLASQSGVFVPRSCASTDINRSLNHTAGLLYTCTGLFMADNAAATMQTTAPLELRGWRGTTASGESYSTALSENKTVKLPSTLYADGTILAKDHTEFFGVIREPLSNRGYIDLNDYGLAMIISIGVLSAIVLFFFLNRAAFFPKERTR